ncbi:MAG TPA: HAD family hydrolase [Xanthobacteraceae bacterium]|nr:HAD family hydrolase [Xanthobacteraceae bacterium]
MTLLIFDCDGVLVDSEVLALDTLREMMASLGRPMTMGEADREFTGGSLADTLATAQRLLGRPIPPGIGERFGQLLLDRFRRELKPVQGVRDAILALPYRRCVASSSSPERLRLSLDVSGLAPLFEHVFSAVEVDRGKPAPDLYLLAARTLAEPPEGCIVIEDAPRGVVAGRAAGMRVIGFAGAAHAAPTAADDLRRAGAEVVIRSMDELPAIVRSLTA